VPDLFFESEIGQETLLSATAHRSVTMRLFMARPVDNSSLMVGP
jgi:hypothetical protein